MGAFTAKMVRNAPGRLLPATIPNLVHVSAAPKMHPVESWLATSEVLVPTIAQRVGPGCQQRVRDFYLQEERT